MPKIVLVAAFALLSLSSGLTLDRAYDIDKAAGTARDLTMEGHFVNLSRASQTTGCNKLSGQTLEYLDRHQLNCGAGKSMTDWKLIRAGCTGEDMQFEYNCADTPSSVGSIERSTGWQEGQGKNLEYLDRHNVACSAGEAMTAWRVNMGGHQLRFIFSCLPLGLGTPASRETGCSLMLDHKVENLDRHNVACNSGEVLTSFRVQDCNPNEGSHQNMKIIYGCAVLPTPSPTPSPTPPTSSPTPTPTPRPTIPPPNPNAPSATGDPHLINANGDKYDVNQPGEHTLVRVPSDRKLSALLEMNVSLQAGDNEICGIWIQRVQFSGALFDNSVVNVWPQVQSDSGGHCPGSLIMRPFSFQVEGGAHGPVTGRYVREHSHTWDDYKTPDMTVGAPAWTFTSDNSTCVDILPSFRKSLADRGLALEAEAFMFSIRACHAAKDVLASVEVSQRNVSRSCHQALDVRVRHLEGLGVKRIGGLLGTEGHDAQIEQFTSECAAFKALKGRGHRIAEGQSQSGSTMIASDFS